MRKWSLIVAVPLLIATVFAGLVVLLEGARAATLYVGGTGAGNYTFIQDAIDDAYPGDTVYVFSGTYLERIMINKTISLIGEDGNVTIYGTGGVTYTVINVSADWVNITGFTLQDPAEEVTFGLLLNHTKFVTIRDCNISGNAIGIYLRYSENNTLSTITAINRDTSIRLRFSHYNTISNSKLASRNMGIYLHQSSNNTLTDLSVGQTSFLTRWGVDLYCSPDNIIANSEFLMNLSIGITGIFSFDSPRTYIENNTIMDSFNGIGFQGVSSGSCTAVNNTISGGINIGISASSHNAILNNTVSGYSYGIYNANRDLIAGNTLHSNYFGMGITDSNTVTGNTIHRNEKGILLFGDNNTVVNNSIFLNGGYGIHVSSGGGNRVYHNSFVTNFVQAFDEGGPNQWDNGYPSGGNYWSDYAGVDEKSGPGQDLPGSDGIGDIPREIDYGTRDRYPLMSPTARPPPRPLTRLRAALSGSNLENVTLIWSLSPDDGGGFRTVVGYDIHRGTTLDPQGSGYALIASVPNGIKEFVDHFAGEGDPQDYFYRVCAKDTRNNTECALEQAGKFTRMISSGPNLVSIPLIQSNESIESAFQTLSFDKAWFYDSFNQEWKSRMRFKSYGTLGHVNHTLGVWANVTKDSNLTVAGTVPSQTAIQLQVGWNLVGFPSFNTTYTVADLKAETGATRVEGFDPAPPYFLRVLADGETLQAGYGYWIRVGSDVTWFVTAS